MKEKFLAQAGRNQAGIERFYLTEIDRCDKGVLAPESQKMVALEAEF